jgi:hypothetical protein
MEAVYPVEWMEGIVIIHPLSHHTPTVLTIHQLYSPYTHCTPTVLSIHPLYSPYTHCTHHTHTVITIHTVLTIHPLYSPYTHRTHHTPTEQVNFNVTMNTKAIVPDTGDGRDALVAEWEDKVSEERSERTR